MSITPSFAQNRFERNYPRSTIRTSSESTISAQPSFENNHSHFDAPAEFSHRAVSRDPTLHLDSHGQPASYHGQPASYYGQPASYGQPMAPSSLLQRPQAGSQRDRSFPAPSYTAPVASMRGYPSPSHQAAPSPSHYHSQSQHGSSRDSQSSGGSSSLSRSHSPKHDHSTPRPLYSRQQSRSSDLSRSPSSSTTNIIHSSSRYPTIIHPSEQSTIVKGRGGWVVVPPMGRDLIVLDVSSRHKKKKKKERKERRSLLFDL